MTFQPCPDAAVAVLHFQLLGKEMANVLNFQFPSPPSQTDIDNLALDVDAWVTANYLPLISSAVNYSGTEVRGLSSPVDLSAFTAAGAANGALTGLCFAANASLCLSLRTGATGRTARGRVYLVPTSTGEETDAQTFGSAYTADAVVAFTALQPAVNADGWTWVVLSRHLGGVVRPAGVTRRISSVIARNRAIDSQRNRLANNH